MSDPGRFAEDPRNEILVRYSRAYQENPELTPGEFMMRARPGVYRNEQSASRAFRKLRSGETSGRQIYRRSFYVKHYYRKGKDAQGNQLYEERLERPRGGYQIGLWKVNLTFEAITEDGDKQTITRSFIAESSQYESAFDIPEIEARLGPAIEDHLSDWIDAYSLQSVQLKSVEVLKIEHTTKPSAMQVILD